jgi:hypothetical protein
MRDLDELFAALEESHYRRPIRLGPRDHAYLVAKTLPVILEHARGFIRERLAAADPPHDGRQTPRGGHPVFVAQHATATCCRKCLEKWHYIERGTSLDDEHVDYIVRVLERWLRRWLSLARESRRVNHPEGD